MFHDLTVVIPVKDPPDIDEFIRENQWLLESVALIVVDSAGGNPLESFCQRYFKENMPFWEARKLGYQQVKTPYTLNLDVDVIPPKEFVEQALKLLRDGIDAVSIFYEDVNHCQGALEFGVSMWKTDVLLRLYDFSWSLACSGVVKVGFQAYAALHNGWCECTYMFRKLKDSGGRLETLPMRARHLKG